MQPMIDNNANTVEHTKYLQAIIDILELYKFKERKLAEDLDSKEYVIAKINRAFLDEQAEKENIQKELTVVYKELNEKTIKCSEIERYNHNSECMHKELYSKFLKVVQERDEYKNECTKLKDENQQLKEEIQQLNISFDANCDKVKQTLDETIQRLQKQYDEKQTDVDTLKEENKKLKQQPNTHQSAETKPEKVRVRLQTSVYSFLYLTACKSEEALRCLLKEAALNSGEENPITSLQEHVDRYLLTVVHYTTNPSEFIAKVEKYCRDVGFHFDAFKVSITNEN